MYCSFFNNSFLCTFNFLFKLFFLQHSTPSSEAGLFLTHPSEAGLFSYSSFRSWSLFLLILQKLVSFLTHPSEAGLFCYSSINSWTQNINIFHMLDSVLLIPFLSLITHFSIYIFSQPQHGLLPHTRMREQGVM